MRYGTHNRSLRTVLIMTCGLIGCVYTGCVSSESLRTSPDARVASFHQAGPIRFALDKQRLVQSGLETGAYTVVPGDLLEFEMPVQLQMVTSKLVEVDTEQRAALSCRVNDQGCIALPIIGAQSVAGRTLTQIERDVSDAYYPRYIRTDPGIVVSVKKYRTYSVSITGAIQRPGVYPLRHDQLSLVCLLMEAGGIVDEGASVISITRKPPNKSAEDEKITEATPRKEQSPSPILLPVKGLNTPFRDVRLQEGDNVIVKGFEEQVFTVLGLVQRQGAFPYPTNAQYNLLEALAFAGGVDGTADPHYVRVYRQALDGTTVDATFSIKDRNAMAQSLAVPVKPGDVIVVEQTTRTRLNLLLADVLSVRAGLGLQYLYYGGRDERKLRHVD